MRRTLTVAVTLTAAAALLATVAAAQPDPAKQRVIIRQVGNSFVLTSSGAIRHDRGAFTACCWTTRHVVVAGQRLELNNPQLTLTGRNGTLMLRNRIEWVDLPGPGGWSSFTGTWKVVRGTRSYTGLAGTGRVVGIQSASGRIRARLFGFLKSK